LFEIASAAMTPADSPKTKSVGLVRMAEIAVSDAPMPDMQNKLLIELEGGNSDLIEI
jgi:hypothetical protein